MPIQALYFDFGGVLLRTHDWAPRLRWDARLGLPPGSVEQAVFNSPQGQAAQHGRLSAATHWQQLGAQWGLSAAELDQMRADFWAGDALDATLIAALRTLRGRYRIGLISNAFDSLRDELTHRWQIADLFDAITISAELGVMKPAPVVFLHALGQFGIAAEAAVFIDDFAHNIAGARAVGLHAIHYPPTLQAADLLAALHDLGIREQATGDGEQVTGDREQVTGDRKLASGH